MNLITVESLMKSGYSVTRFDGRAHKDPVEKPTKKRTTPPYVRGRRVEIDPEEHNFYMIWLDLQKGDEKIIFEQEYFDQLVFARDLREIGRILNDEAETVK